MRLAIAAAVAAFAAAPTLAFAAAPAPGDATADRTRAKVEKLEVPTSPFKASAELGSSLTRGNTETFHLNLDARAIWRASDVWLSTTKAKALYEEAALEGVDTVTANSWGASERVDRFLIPQLSIFGGLGLEQDEFAGLAQRTSAQLGVSWLAIETRDAERENLLTDRLAVDLGAYAAQENYVLSPLAAPGTVLPATEATVLAGRLAAAYVHTFSKGNDAGLELELIQDVLDTDNLVTTESAYLAAVVTGGVSVKLSVQHKYDAVPADPALKEHDLLASAAIVVAYEAAAR